MVAADDTDGRRASGVAGAAPSPPKDVGRTWIEVPGDDEQPDGC